MTAGCPRQGGGRRPTNARPPRWASRSTIRGDPPRAARNFDGEPHVSLTILQRRVRGPESPVSEHSTAQAQRIPLAVSARLMPVTHRPRDCGGSFSLSRMLARAPKPVQSPESRRPARPEIRVSTASLTTLVATAATQAAPSGEFVNQSGAIGQCSDTHTACARRRRTALRMQQRYGSSLRAQAGSDDLRSAPAINALAPACASDDRTRWPSLDHRHRDCAMQSSSPPRSIAGLVTTRAFEALPPSLGQWLTRWTAFPQEPPSPLRARAA